MTLHYFLGSFKPAMRDYRLLQGELFATIYPSYHPTNVSGLGYSNPFYPTFKVDDRCHFIQRPKLMIDVLQPISELAAIENIPFFLPFPGYGSKFIALQAQKYAVLVCPLVFHHPCMGASNFHSDRMNEIDGYFTNQHGGFKAEMWWYNGGVEELITEPGVMLAAGSHRGELLSISSRSLPLSSKWYTGIPVFLVTTSEGNSTQWLQSWLFESFNLGSCYHL